MTDGRVWGAVGTEEVWAVHWAFLNDAGVGTMLEGAGWESWEGGRGWPHAWVKCGCGTWWGWHLLVPQSYAERKDQLCGSSRQVAPVPSLSMNSLGAGLCPVSSAKKSSDKKSLWVGSRNEAKKWCG